MITEEQKQAFEKFLQIIQNSDDEEIALLQAKEKKTGRDVCLISHVAPPNETDDSYTITPLAELLFLDDIDRYEDPNGEEAKDKPK